MVDEPDSRYPYSDDGKIAVAPDADWLDPLLALSFAAAPRPRSAACSFADSFHQRRHGRWCTRA